MAAGRRVHRRRCRRGWSGTARCSSGTLPGSLGDRLVTTDPSEGGVVTDTLGQSQYIAARRHIGFGCRTRCVPRSGRSSHRLVAGRRCGLQQLAADSSNRCAEVHAQGIRLSCVRRSASGFDRAVRSGTSIGMRVGRSACRRYQTPGHVGGIHRWPVPTGSRVHRSTRVISSMDSTTR